MSESNHAALAALLEQARRAEPPLQTPLEARRSVRLAVHAAEQQTRRQKPRWALLVAACAGLALAFALTLRLRSHDTMIEVAADALPLRFSLTSGDTVLAGAGTKLEVRAQEAARRELSLLAGNALFDVQRLGAQQRFVVHTAQADVVVHGTVFSVEVTGGRTIVRVYEGRVQVAERTLSAGEVWVSRGPALLLEGDPLAADGLAAAARRKRAPALVVSTLPDVQPVTAEADTGAALGVIEPTAPAPPATISLEQARAWLLAGDSERALLAALSSDHSDLGARAEPRVATQPAWLLLEADALRALRRNGEAVDTYQHVAELAPSLRVSAGYAGASLALYELQDAARTLTLLDSLALDDIDSPLRERATVLRVDALLSLGRRAEAQTAARRYLEREPETQVSARMRALVADAGAWPSSQRPGSALQ